MVHLRSILEDAIIGFNVLALSYFFLGNGVYTILMMLSLRATRAHVQQISYQGLGSLRRSPLTPPVTIIIPAWNEQQVIVNSVRSALQVDYPFLQIVVVDDGSTDQTLDRLINAFALVEVDAPYFASLPTAPIRAVYINPALPNLLVSCPSDS